MMFRVSPDIPRPESININDASEIILTTFMTYVPSSSPLQHKLNTTSGLLIYRCQFARGFQEG